MRSSEHRARVGTASLYYEVAGRGEPLILIHGLAGSSLWWARNVRVLARHLRVYTLDLHGFGRGRGQRFVLHEAAHVLQAWMDARDLRRAVVVGHSMGGFTAADLAAHAPERVERLVLVDAAVLPIGRGMLRHRALLEFLSKDNCEPDCAEPPEPCA